MVCKKGPGENTKEDKYPWFISYFSSFLHTLFPLSSNSLSFEYSQESDMTEQLSLSLFEYPMNLQPTEVWVYDAKFFFCCFLRAHNILHPNQSSKEWFQVLKDPKSKHLLILVSKLPKFCCLFLLLIVYFLF